MVKACTLPGQWNIGIVEYQIGRHLKDQCDIYFMPQYLASEINGRWEVGQCWRKISIILRARCRGGETTKQPFPSHPLFYQHGENLLLSAKVQRELKQAALS